MAWRNEQLRERGFPAMLAEVTVDIVDVGGRGGGGKVDGLGYGLVNAGLDGADHGEVAGWRDLGGHLVVSHKRMIDFIYA